MLLVRTVAALLLCSAISFAGTLETMHLEVGGETREFTLFTPNSYEPNVPMPLILSLHGFTSDAATQQLVTGMNSVAERKGVLVAYPQAIGNDWWPGNVPGSNIDYLVSVYEETLETRNVNEEIVGVTGMSQGSSMSLTLVASHPNLFSSVVSVAGTRFHSIEGDPLPLDVPEVPTRPISRLHIHGTADPFVSIGGGQILDFPLYNVSVIDSVSNWAAGMGSEGEPTVVPIEDRVADGLTSELLSWQGRTYTDIHGTEYTVDTEYLKILGGGHNWPGDFDGWPGQFLPVTKDFSASEAAIDFILSHPREYIVGDVTRNGVLDVDDMNLLVRESASGSNTSAFDITGDGLVDGLDVTFWARDLKHTWIGDANLDGEFNSADLVEVFQAGKYELGLDAGWVEGDWTGDGRFDSSDMVSAFQDGGYELGARTVATAVPEPTSCVLVLIGALAICRLRRR